MLASSQISILTAFSFSYIKFPYAGRFFKTSLYLHSFIGIPSPAWAVRAFLYFAALPVLARINIVI